ncbi:hypothetical protein [Lentibacillus salinarum]|uniref:Uncharacterized protein n=1 Tax=Lentibacillus salinarum TaxID=446820 RepID=A0ABW3ZYA0_9BACI
MKKLPAIILIVLLFIGGVSYVVLSSDEEAETTSQETPEFVEDSESQTKINSETIPEDWTQERFNETKDNFGSMTTIEDVKREIVQMTSQKVESKRVRELKGNDAPTFPFTPVYPSQLGEFETPSDYAALTEDNIVYLKNHIEGLELDAETHEYFQEFLTEWENGDFSNLIEVHKTFLLEVSNPPEELRDFLEVDNYRLATEEEEQAFLEHYGLINQ